MSVIDEALEAMRKLSAADLEKEIQGLTLRLIDARRALEIITGTTEQTAEPKRRKRKTKEKTDATETTTDPAETMPTV
jgi:hypothetical protein